MCCPDLAGYLRESDSAPLMACPAMPHSDAVKRRVAMSPRSRVVRKPRCHLYHTVLEVSRHRDCVCMRDMHKGKSGLFLGHDGENSSFEICDRPCNLAGSKLLPVPSDAVANSRNVLDLLINLTRDIAVDAGVLLRCQLIRFPVWLQSAPHEATDALL